ncbi:MAG: hypothetical protein HYR74_10420 [Candidatus Eisenbacteria bacterium]|nr:hypothetical protein [Candidatus Eisenbacteria bacterium]
MGARIAVLALAVACLLLAQRARAEDAPAPAAIAPPRLGGYLQARETWQENVGLTSTLNRVRLSVEGALPNRFAYRVAVELEAGGGARTAATASLRDAYVRWTDAWLALEAGQFKTPFSRDYVTSLTTLETIDRPVVVDSLATKRDIGVMAEASAGNVATLSAGVFNGEGQNIPANRDSTVLWVGRGVVRPVSQVTLGASGAAYGSDSTHWGFEASVEQNGLIARGEWIAQHRRNVPFDDEGWFVVGAGRVLPWAQAFAMQEDLVRRHLGFGARVRATTVGANLDLGSGRTQLTVEYVARRSGATQASRRAALAQFQVKF